MHKAVYSKRSLKPLKTWFPMQTGTVLILAYLYKPWTVVTSAWCLCHWVTMDLSSHTGATETSPLAWILLHSQKFLSVQAMMIALLLKLKTQAIQFHLSLKVEVSNLFQLITIYVDIVNFVVQNYNHMALNLLRVLIWQIGNILYENCIFLLELSVVIFSKFHSTFCFIWAMYMRSNAQYWIIVCHGLSITVKNFYGLLMMVKLHMCFKHVSAEPHS